jgi:GNAT superfamily N-acetyltransferase
MALSLTREVVVEPASMRDWSRICQLVAQNFPLQSEAAMGYWLCHQRPYFQVARLDGEVIGFMHAQPQPDTGTLWINMLAVDARYRHRGVGHRLVVHFDSVCRDWHCTQVELQCLRTNVEGLRLYQRHGYLRVAEAITQHGLQVIVHRKPLPEGETLVGIPRPPVRLDRRLQRLAYRLFYLGWFRRHSPVPD